MMTISAMRMKDGLILTENRTDTIGRTTNAGIDYQKRLPMSKDITDDRSTRTARLDGCRNPATLFNTSKRTTGSRLVNHQLSGNS